MTKPDLMAELAEVVQIDRDKRFMSAEGEGRSADALRRLFQTRAADFLRTHHAELEAVVRDAARYRWLVQAIPGQICIDALCQNPMPDDDMDEAIDQRIDAMHNSAREG